MFRIPYVITYKGNTVSNLITWEIPKFSDVIKKGQELRAECTNKDDMDDCNFQLKMEFLDKNKKSIDIFFICRNKVYLNFIQWMSPAFNDDIDGRNKWKNYTQCIIQPYKWYHLNTCLIDSINMHIHRDLLRVELQFTMIDDPDTDHIFEPESQMSRDFGNLFSLISFSDAVIESSDGKKYMIHRAIVTSRSAVLKAHFEHNTTESLTNVLKSPLESEVLNEVLKFIYTDRAPKIDEMPEKLLEAADFYQLIKLKALSEKAIYRKLTVQNAIEYLVLADLHSSEELKKSIQEYIKDGRGTALIHTEGWTKLKSIELIKGLMECLMKTNEK